VPAVFIDPSIELTSRILGTLIFTASLAGKVRHLDEWVGIVANYRLAPDPFARPLAGLVITLEALVVLLLGAGLAPRVGAALAICLLCVFAIAMTVNLLRGRTEIDCGCFQPGSRQRLSVALVVRNLLVVLVLSLSLGAASQSQSFLQWLDGIGAGVVIFLLYQTVGQILALRSADFVAHKEFV
jgi:uncharacterized membrane protein YphA (DoxX/SURF4 family)